MNAYISLVWMVLCLWAAAAFAALPETRTPIVLRMVGPEDVGRAWATIIRRFETTHPGIRVRYISGPWSTDDRLNMYIRAFVTGAPFELVYMDVTWTARFAARGWLVPLDNRLPRTKWARFLPGDIAAGQYRGRLYRVPVRSDVGVLYYRTDWVRSPPRTWTELLRICRRVAHPPERYCLVFQGMQYEGLVCNFMEFYWNGGGPPALDFQHPAGWRALQMMQRLIAEEWVPRSVLGFQEQHSLEFFMRGKAVFMRNWPYAWNVLQRDDSPLRGKVGIAPLPTRDGSPGVGTLGGWGLGIARSIPSRHIEAAWQFIRFVIQPDQQKILHFRRGAVPVLRSLYRDPEVLARSPHYPALFRSLLHARPRPVHPDYPWISDTLQKHVSGVLAGVETPEEARTVLRRSMAYIRRARRLPWWVRIIRDVDLHRTVWNTLKFTLWSVPLEMLLGLLIALAVHRPPLGRRWLRLAVLIPWALPTAVMAMSWQWMFNRPFGVINDMLVRLGVLDRPIDWLAYPSGAMFAAVFADVWKTTPFVVIILLAGLQTIPRELEQSLAVDGGGAWARLRYLVLPLLLPFIRVALIFRFIHAAGIFDLIWVLTHGGPADRTRTLAIYIYEVAFRYDDIGYGLFLTAVFLIVLIGGVIGIIRMTTLRYEHVSA